MGVRAIMSKNRTEQNRTEQNRTEQNRTEQNRTEQNRTEQNRTEQNRTEQSLTDKIEKIERLIFGICRKYGKFVLVNVLFGCAVYFMLMSNHLVNDVDGVWHLSNYVAGRGEISSGRGLLRYIDKLRFGIVSTPYITIISMFVIAVGNALVCSILHMEEVSIRYLISFFLIANPVVCNTLTYGFASIGYAVSYLFAVAATAVFRYTQKTYRVLLCGSAIAISMHCYQAYLGVTCVILLFLLMEMLDENKKIFEIFMFLRDAFLGIICGGGFYYIFLKFMLWYAKTGLSDYRGINDLSFAKMIKYLPYSVRNCYMAYFSFFKDGNMSINTTITKYFLAGFFLLIFIKLLCFLVRAFKNNVILGILGIIAIVCIPVASNASILLAVGSVPTLLMSMGMVYIVVLWAILNTNGKKWLVFVEKRIKIFLIAVALWISVSVVENDQLALKEGIDATVMITQNILNELMEKDYLTNYDYHILFYGRPANNPMFAWSTAYSLSNGYAKFGHFSTQAGNNRRTWCGVISGLCGINIAYGGEDRYEVIQQSKELKDMPVYPHEGSIVLMDHTVVIKVSDLY